MRRSSVLGGQLKFIYPDEICFAFNPNYLVIETSIYSSLQVQVYLGLGTQYQRSKTIKVKLYNSRATVYLSRLFELIFEEPKCARSLPINVRVVDVGDNGLEAMGGETELFTFSTLVIWGSLAPGERFNAIGVYKDQQDKRQFERTLVWFKKFPFSVTAFKYKGEVSFRGRYDEKTYESSNRLVATREGWSFNGIKEFDVPTINTGSISSPANIIYFTSLRKFLAEAPDGTYYENWSGGHSSGSSSADLMDSETGLPKKDIDYLWKDDNGLPWLFRFDGYNLIKCGLNFEKGFVEIFPEKSFPDAQRTAVIRYNTGDIVNLFSTFDNSFDYTFFNCDDTVTIIKLLICNDIAGHYLRWIDSQGQLQYFLFKKGQRSSKTALSGNTIEMQEPIRNMYFPNMSRTQNVSLTVTHKAGAVHLPPEIFEYVKSIVTSPLIDLFMGKDKEDNEIWVPVTIESGSYEYNYKEQLHDIEITFSVPAYTPQSL